MSTVTVQRRSRADSKARHLRKQGILPMALVEKTHQTTLLQAPVEGMKSAIRAADGLGRISLQFEGEGKPMKALIKNIEVDPIRHEMIHITLQEVSEGDVVTVDLHVSAIGEPTALETGDYLFMAVTEHVKVKGKLSDLPEKLEYDVTGLEPNHHVQASDLTLPDGVELVSSPDATLFSLRAPAAEESETEDATAEGADAGSAGETSAEA